MKPELQYRDEARTGSGGRLVCPRASSDEDWMVVEVAEAKEHLVAQASRLEHCYPRRYDMRITCRDQARHFAGALGQFELAVRHRTEDRLG